MAPRIRSGLLVSGNHAGQVFDLPNPRIDWSVLDWNETALAFYRSIGAHPLSGWSGWRLDGDALQRFGRHEV